MLTAVLFLLGLTAFAQSNNVKGVLIDDSTGEPVSFATVSLTREGQSRPTKYALTDDKGAFTLESVRNGNYQIRAELMGYIPHEAAVKMESKAIDLGQIKMAIDREQLEAAEVSALGNQVIIKKDTIEYNATSFLSTDNDNLIDLLKKMPGIEVADNGTISVNGQSVSKITVQGKTFFLDDPQVASQNIPAKLVQKLKVIRKKSEQAEFTGIDDGQEETVIDLTVQQGAMNGLVGRVTAGAGHDIPSEQNPLNDYRFSGNAFLGRFSENTQISLILNANNANVQGATNFSGNAMAGMRGGGGGMGGGGGISTNYMAGLNAAGNLFDDRMEIGGNYNYNNSTNEGGSRSSTLSYLTGFNQLVNSESNNVNKNDGHNFGLRLEHKFSDNTSILFQPSIRFGGGNYVQTSQSETYRDLLDGSDMMDNKLNDAYTNNTGTNKNFSTSGFFLFRQRLGLPGRTLTSQLNFSASTNDMDAINSNGTNYYTNGVQTGSNTVLQNQVSSQQSYSINSRTTYTEPLGNYFYLEANYSFIWSKSLSDQTAYDLLNDRAIDYNYSNEITNINRRHEIGGNLLYQNDILHMQAGFSLMPQYTYNSTSQFDPVSGLNTPRVYEDPHRWNYSPQVMLIWNMSDAANVRFNYRGTSGQPSTQQLMPVPDNTNPLRVSFGNPSLTPYFTHNISTEYRYNNRVRFSSFTLRANGGFTQNQISNVVITGANGGQYTMPFNSPATANAGLNFFNNMPIGKSAFTINNTTGATWRQSFAYEGVGVDMSKYTNEGFYEFMDWFLQQFNDPTYYAAHIVENYTDNLNINERLRLSYRGRAIQINLGLGTTLSQTWYTQKGAAAEKSTSTGRNSQTWSNNASADLTWNWTLTGMSFTANANYRWYNGFTTPVDPQAIINMTVAKSFGPVNMSLYVADLLGQSRALSVSDSASRHVESVSDTLGRYVILSLSYNFGTMGRGNRMRGGGGGNRGGGMPGGFGGGRGGFGGGGFGGGRPM